MNHTYVAIMAGGVGSRFWPGSREDRPKQFLDIMGVGKSLIRLTFERFLNLCPADHILIVTNAIYKDQVLEHLPEISPDQILCEPTRNNTAPCVAYTAFKLLGMDPKANFVVAPSDHIIKDEKEFIRIVKEGLKFVSKNEALLTLGIKPARPDTGYGYIKYKKKGENGIHEVMRFTEKPKAKKAKAFVDSGNYLWNAGIFIWNVQSILQAFEYHSPDIFEIFLGIQDSLNTAEEQKNINEVYPGTPKISIDVAILEKAANVYTMPSDFGWSDLGTWDSLHEEVKEKDKAGNVVFADDSILEKTTGCLIRAPKDKLVVVRGLENFIIVDEDDVLLIYPRSKEQKIKEVTQGIRKELGKKYL